jgi:hypothetical protein
LLAVFSAEKTGAWLRFFYVLSFSLIMIYFSCMEGYSVTWGFMQKIIAILFALCCFSTAAVSHSLMGAGMWFWIIIGMGGFVAVSQYMPQLQDLGAGCAAILSVISVAAVMLGLVAATIGGSFRLQGQEALLLFLFFLIAVNGFTLLLLNKRRLKASIKY